MLFTLLSFFYRVSVVFASFFSWRGLFFFLRRDNGCRFFSQIVTKCLMALRIESWGQISRRENVGRNQKWYNAQRRGHTKEEDGRNIFFDPPPRIMKIKTKIIKWDLVKLKSFCTAKETINKMKRKPTERKKIFANCETGNRLIWSTLGRFLKNLKIEKWAHILPSHLKWGSQVPSPQLPCLLSLP